jgi:hypothetical protein
VGGEEPNPWFLRVGEIGRARQRWRRVLTKVEKVLKLLQVGNAVQTYTAAYVYDLYHHVEEQSVQTDTVQGQRCEAGVQTDSPPHRPCPCPRRIGNRECWFRVVRVAAKLVCQVLRNKKVLGSAAVVTGYATGNGPTALLELVGNHIFQRQ